jgi:hypothetical protein
MCFNMSQYRVSHVHGDVCLQQANTVTTEGQTGCPASHLDLSTSPRMSRHAHGQNSMAHKPPSCPSCRAVAAGV